MRRFLLFFWLCVCTYNLQMKSQIYAMPMMLVEENEFEASYFKSAKGERFDELIRVFGKSTRAVCYSNTTLPVPSSAHCHQLPLAWGILSR